MGLPSSTFASLVQRRTLTTFHLRSSRPSSSVYQHHHGLQGCYQADAGGGRDSQSESRSLLAACLPWRKCALNWWVLPRTRVSVSRDQSVCLPKFFGSPPARLLAVRGPRPGTGTKCASTSASLTSRALLRWSSRSPRSPLSLASRLRSPLLMPKLLASSWGLFVL